MYNFLSKNGQLAAFLLGIVMVGIFLIIALSGIGDYPNLDTMEDADIFKVNIFNFGIAAAIALAVICIVAIVILGLVNTANDFKSSIKGLIGVAVLGGILFLFYSMSSGEIDHPSIQGSVEKILESGGTEPTSGQLKWIGGGLGLGILMSVISVVLMLVMPVIAPIINRIK